MRIAITMLSHDASWGGIGIYTKEIVRHLLELDRDNEYVLIYPGFGNARKDLGQYAAEYGNVTEVQTRRSVPWAPFWEQVVVPPVVRKHDIDLFFNPFWSVPVFGKYKKVMTVHGVDCHVMPETLSRKTRFEWALHSRVWVHRADAVISISDVMTRDLIKYDHLPPEKIHRIYHGRAEHFRPIDDREELERARRQYGLPEKYILFVGLLFPKKNFGNLLRAFARIADRMPHNLVVAGNPRWKYAGDMSLVDSLGVRDRVQFLAHVPNDDLPAIYNLAECLAFPTLYEEFGLVGLEALASGCPVAAANTAALPEVLGDAAVFYDPRDVEDMAGTLGALLEDPGLRQRCRARGLERVKEFTWERTAGETLRLFRALVE